MNVFFFNYYSKKKFKKKHLFKIKISFILLNYSDIEPLIVFNNSDSKL